ncbi:50S ribosomal protein L19 [Candidatus Shapirobacteria bacterium]|nr:MAG: 50S ribosomal protein L19 [Candidatus Shapirobacteria bacterium]
MALTITFNDKKFSIGDTIRVNYKIKETKTDKSDKKKERIQAFDGILIAIKGQKDDRTFTVLKNASDAVKVERIFPLNSPWIESIEKLRSPKRKVRRSKLYFLRNPRARKL